MVVSFGYGGIPKNVLFFRIQNASIARKVQYDNRRDYIQYVTNFMLNTILQYFYKNLVDWWSYNSLKTHIN